MKQPLARRRIYVLVVTPRPYVLVEDIFVVLCRLVLQPGRVPIQPNWVMDQAPPALPVSTSPGTHGPPPPPPPPIISCNWNRSFGCENLLIPSRAVTRSTFQPSERCVVVMVQPRVLAATNCAQVFCGHCEPLQAYENFILFDVLMARLSSNSPVCLRRYCRGIFHLPAQGSRSQLGSGSGQLNTC